jgi:tetratricopeptide (TPR) repeat protein
VDLILSTPKSDIRRAALDLVQNQQLLGEILTGACGKDATTATLQDVLFHVTKGISMYARRAAALGARDREIDVFTVEALFSTVTNVNFNPENLVSIIERAAGLRDRAKALYEKASPVIERSGDRLQQIRYCNNMGFLLCKTKDWEGAKRLFDRQIRIAKMMEDRRWEGWAYSKMSECLSHLGEPKAGLQYAEMSKQALEEVNDNVGLPHTYLVFGIAYGAIGDKARAVENFEKAVRLAEASNMGSIAASSTLEYACALAKLDKGLALVQARRALEMFTKMKATRCIDECKVLIRGMGG